MTGIDRGNRSVSGGGRGRVALLRTTALATLWLAGVSQAGAQEVAKEAAQEAGRPGAIELPALTVEDRAPSPRPVEGYSAKRTSAATRTDTPLLDVPQSVTVVPREVIRDQGMQGLADVVRYVPGVSAAQGEGNRDQLTIRGNNTTADFFVDGVRDDAQYFRDLYNLDRVEVLKGPNAMVFGRGGGGGVVNRVLKEATGETVREVTLQGGSFGNRRAAVDLGQALTDGFSGRLNAVYENSGSHRSGVELERLGINPAVTFTPGDATKVKLSYEYFRDERTADRGVPSFRGRPVETGTSTFFGDPDLSVSETDAHAVDALIEHEIADGLTIRNRSRYARHDKFYQNVFPGAVNAAGTQVNLAAYNSAVERENLFNQTDLVHELRTGPVEHKLLAGVEIGRQTTDSFRNTGYFPGNATNLAVPLGSPTVSAPVAFRQSATDADSRSTATVAAAYVQDQIQLGDRWQVIAGLRHDRFDLDFQNNRTGQELSRTDGLWSPRLGLVFKPVEPVSLYASYGVSHLPGSGDQFTSLTSTSATLEPERFENWELGAKWEALDNLSLTAAAFRLDRTNTTAPDPNNPGLVVQTGSTRTRGVELGFNGNLTEDWQVIGGYAHQDAEITGTTSAARAGATVPLVPRHSFSLWSKYRFTPIWAAALGAVHQTEAYAGADNSVTLPGFTRLDAAAYAEIDEGLRLQINVQNILGREYFGTAHSNNNITPGAPRTFLVSLTGDF